MTGCCCWRNSVTCWLMCWLAGRGRLNSLAHPCPSTLGSLRWPAELGPVLLGATTRPPLSIDWSDGQLLFRVLPPNLAHADATPIGSTAAYLSGRPDNRHKVEKMQPRAGLHGASFVLPAPGPTEPWQDGRGDAPLLVTSGSEIVSLRFHGYNPLYTSWAPRPQIRSEGLSSGRGEVSPHATQSPKRR